MSDKPTDWQARIDKIVGSKVRVEEVPCGPPDRREHPLAGCRRRHTKGEDCLLGCVCPCHRDTKGEVDMGTPCKTADQLAAAIARGTERAVAELASLPADDGTVSVSTLDSRTYVREGFKLCLSCGWRRGPGGRCTC